MITGCTKLEVGMNIKKDKSMTLVIIQAVDKSLLEQSTTTTILTEEDKIKLKEKGIKIEDYNIDNMIGYKITKEIKNIDEISSKEELIANLATEELSNNEYLFTIKKGIFKNTYKATLKNSDVEEINNSLNSGLQNNYEKDNELGENVLEDNIELEDEDLIGDDEVIEDNASNDLNNLDYSELLSNMELTMKVNLPYKALSNNATNIKNEGKTLTWNLMELKGENIEFEFIIYNIPNIIITIVAIILLIITIILLLTKKKKEGKVLPTKDNSLNKKELNTSNIRTILETTKENQEITNIQLIPMPKPIKLDAITNIQNIPEQSKYTEIEQNQHHSQYDSILQESTDKN